MEDQQQEAHDGPRGEGAATDPMAAARKKKLELARADVLRQLAAAQAEAHREMLRRALAALDKDLGFGPSDH